jgi:DNA (cytosine-5)-methyltransferase 1
MKILNLYAGIGGNRNLWGESHEVTAVEFDPNIARVYEQFFPNDNVIVGDAHEYLIKNYESFDFIWASPPCTTHSRINKNFSIIRYADMKLYQEIIFLKTWFKGKFCVENVIPYYGQEGLIIRDLPVQQYHRHLFWCNFKIRTTDKGNPPKQITIKAQKSRNKTFIKTNDTDSLAELLGMPKIKEKVYVNGNHSPGQLYRNCVKPELGKMILDCALGIMEKQNTRQLSLL